LSSSIVGTGASGVGTALVVDANNNIFATGTGGITPTPGGYQTASTDAYVVKQAPGTNWPSLSASPPYLGFAAQELGTSSSPQTVTLTNSGGSAASIGIATQGPYSTSDNCGGSLAVGASCNINVVYQPLSTTITQGAVMIYSNAPNSPLSVSADGGGDVAPGGIAVPASQSMNTTLGSTSTVSFTIQSISFGGPILRRIRATASGRRSRPAAST
jgi:hypothetical protein